jgi:hypothetical protein
MSARFSRNDFLAVPMVAGLLGTAVPVAAVADEPTPAPSPSAVPVKARPAFTDYRVPFVFDRAKFGAVIAQPYAHRQVAAATTFDAASWALHFMDGTLEGYSDPNGFAAGEHAVHVVAVFYAGVAPIITFDDAMWAKYPLNEGAIAKPDAGPLKRDPAIPAAKRKNAHAAAMADLVTKHNANFFICNNALKGIVAVLAGIDAPNGVLTRERYLATYAEITSHLLPGTMIVPTGVSALNAVQEARYTLVPAQST